MVSGVGASLSTTLSSVVAASLGRAAGFLGIAAVALAALLLLWLLMPETHPSNEKRVRMTCDQVRYSGVKSKCLQKDGWRDRES
jgi:predicted MFS family arabinose efflux permease